jgi:photosystem II stability/assembly factor-like uncharacterized protein
MTIRRVLGAMVAFSLLLAFLMVWIPSGQCAPSSAKNKDTKKKTQQQKKKSDEQTKDDLSPDPSIKKVEMFLWGINYNDKETYRLLIDVDDVYSFDRRRSPISEINVKAITRKSNEPEKKFMTLKIFRHSNMAFRSDPVIVEGTFSVNDYITIIPDASSILRTVTHPTSEYFRYQNRLLSNGSSIFLWNDYSIYLKRNPQADYWSRWIKGKDRGDLPISLKGTAFIALHPSNYKIVYLIDNESTRHRMVSRLKKSMDTGVNWTTLQNGLPADARLYSVVINHHQTEEVYVGTEKGLFKTSDGGFSWEPTSFKEDVQQLIIHPKEKNILYALSGGVPFISTDGGLKWIRINDNLPKKVVKGKGRTAVQLPVGVFGLAFVNFQEPFLLAAAESGLYRTTDNGATWNSFQDGYDRRSGAYSFYSTNREAYIGGYGCLYKLTEGAGQWERLDISNAGSFPVSGITGLYPLGRDKGFIVCDLDNKLMYVDKNNAVIGLNYGVMRHSAITGLNAAVVDGKTRLYALVGNNHFIDMDFDRNLEFGSYKSLYYSDDYGNTWTRSLRYDLYVDWTNDSLPSNIAVSPHDSRELWVFDKGKTFTTFDGGEIWQPNKNWGSQIAFDPTDGKIRYTCSKHVFKAKSTDSNRVGTATKLNVEADKIAIDKTNNKRILTNTLQLSTDGGWTWTNLSDRFKVEDYRKVSPVYFKANVIVLSHANRLIQSENSGNSWQVMKKLAGNIGPVYVNPSSDENIFVSYLDEEKNIRIIQTMNGGETWLPFCIYNSSSNESAIAMLALQEEGKQAVYIGTIDGLYKTLDNGETWELLGGIRTTVPARKENLKIKKLSAIEAAPPPENERPKKGPKREKIKSSDQSDQIDSEETSRPIKKKKAKRSY